MQKKRQVQLKLNQSQVEREMIITRKSDGGGVFCRNSEPRGFRGTVRTQLE